MRSNGFALVDAILALAVILMVGSIGWAGWRALVDSWRVRAAAEGLVSEFCRIRATAVQANRPFSLLISSDGCSYAVVRPGESRRQWYRWPEGVRCCARPLQPVTFYSRGTAAPAGTFVLEAPAARARVVVAVSGRVRWEWWNHETGSGRR